MNLDKEIAFVLELDKLKSVYRQALVKYDDNRFENSAEHTWHAMMTAYTLKDHFITLNFDINKSLKMLLIHDIVEIDAGDTFVYAPEKIISKQASKELSGAKRIFNILNNSTGQELFEIWQEFNENKTDSAIFANAIDKITPFILNANNNGGTWRNHKIDSKKIRKRNQQLKVIAPILWHYLDTEIDKAIKNGWLT